MRKLCRIEIWKAFHNRWFFIALIAGMLISIFNVGKNFLLAKEYLYKAYPYILSNGMTWGMGDIYGMSVYVNWIGADASRLESAVFWFILPLLAAMPYGVNALREERSKYKNQIFIRSGRKQEAIAKYLAAFLSGGMVVACPVMVNYFVTALFMPLTKPRVTDMSSGMVETQFGSLLFYEHPAIFVALVFLTVFLWGGVFGGMALTGGKFIRKRIFSVCCPFVFCLLIELFFSTGMISTSLEWSPVQLFHTLSIRGTSGIIIFGEIFLFMFSSFFLFWIREVKYEGI